MVTSAQAAARMLADRLPAGAPVLVVGGSGLRMALRERGLRPVTTAADRPLAVVEGFSPDINYSILAEGGLAVAAGALFVASNIDLTLPSRRGNQPGNGSLIQVIAYRDRRAAAGGGQAGAAAAPRVGAARPAPGARWWSGTGWTPTSRALTGWALDSLLVLTGVTEPGGAVLAPPSQRPTYLAEDLTGLLEPQPEVTEPGRRVQLRRLDGALDGDRLELAGGGERIDGLRALCAAAWPPTA